MFFKSRITSDNDPLLIVDFVCAISIDNIGSDLIPLPHIWEAEDKITEILGAFCFVVFYYFLRSNPRGHQKTNPVAGVFAVFEFFNPPSDSALFAGKLLSARFALEISIACINTFWPRKVLFFFTSSASNEPVLLIRARPISTNAISLNTRI